LPIRWLVDARRAPGQGQHPLMSLRQRFCVHQPGAVQGQNCAKERAGAPAAGDHSAAEAGLKAVATAGDR
jgi:hypothetical protein